MKIPNAADRLPGQLRLAIIACHVLWREISLLTAQSPHVYFAVSLRQGLHDEPETLKRELQAEIDKLDGQYDAILIGYGLCSNGICGLRAQKSRLVFMRGHDCITFFLGSRQRYKQLFDDHPGTYWFSTGWIETGTIFGPQRREQLLQQYREQYDDETAEYLMEEEQRWIANYQRACYIAQPWLGSNAARERDFTRQCADFNGWCYDQVEGDGQLLKDFIKGPWTDERFLVVEPGSTIEPSYDEGIVKSVVVVKSIS